MTLDVGLFASSIEHENVYPHPPERVWQALTESELLAAWLMDNDLEEVAVGETFEFRGDPVPLFWDGITRCEVLTVEPHERLKISWWGGGGNPRTEVTWRLEPVADGTRLTVTHEGMDGLRGFIMKMGMRGGWEQMYEEALPEVLRRLEAGEPIPGPGEILACDHAESST